ncbi:nucleotide kinase [Escherichia phage ZG49]|uniref:Nucleotide kinase n=1 Tax=Escherichia phage ZG49 TaxID=1897641 RepID=A0A291NX58_9CAUD|nr:nucleotide kinase [Escherichia phage ZG49]ATJ04770.1 nucleotide kinase [Escherichia phage ZG49]
MGCIACLEKPEVTPTDDQPSTESIDAVRKPSHYQVFDGVESIEIIARSMTVSEFRGFCMGNVLKYRLRAGKKSELATMEKDLNKADFYQELFDLSWATSGRPLSCHLQSSL